MITAVEKVAAIRDAGYKVTVRHLRHVHPNHPLPVITQGVRIAKAKDIERPHGHLQNSSLNAYISLYRRQIRELLAKPRLTEAQQAKDMQTLQNALTDALKERELRGGGGIGSPEDRGTRMMSAFEVPPGWTIRGHGGQTTVTVFVQDGESGQEIVIAKGLASCSEEDLFERRKGFELATQRAIAGAPELRAVIGAYVSEKAVH